jgi:hypothetical protein
MHVGRVMDQHNAQEMKIVVVVVKNGDDDGKDTSLCILQKLGENFAMRYRKRKVGD